VEFLTMTRGWVKAALLAGAAAGVLGLPAPAAADTLRDALNGAYRTNPTLQSARAQQRAIDENVPIEKAAGRPSADASVQYVEFVKQSSASSTSPDRSLSASLDLGVPIYSGGAVKNAVRAAQTRVEAGQADLRGTESAIFSQTVAAYMDVIRGEALVELNANQVEVLRVNTQATSDRFEIGDLTRTDVAQSQARLALAQGDFRSAQANLISAREDYIRLTGLAPDDLEPPPPLPGLPASLGDAVWTALGNNPDIIAARERATASGFDINVAGASRLPRVSVFTGGDYSNFLGSLDIPGSPVSVPQSGTGLQAGVQVSVPIFQGGRPAALQRQAQARSAAAQENVIGAERDVIAQVRSAWSSWQAATEIIASTQSAVDAAALSLEGVRAESTVGNRTILDILNAEQELVVARSQLVTARRNAYVAGFSLLAAMGRAEARDLGLGDDGPLYDPQVNYDRVKNKWWDWERDPDPVAQSTRTVDIPAPTAEIPVNDDSTPGSGVY
jgi:outer membrane protein